MSQNSLSNAAVALGLASTLIMGSCADELGNEDESTQEGESDLGGASLGLSLPDGSEVSTVSYVITRDGDPVEAGTMAVGADGHATKLINGLKTGSGYHVSLAAVRASGSPCAGAADFTVLVDQTVHVTIWMQCDDLAGDTGNAALDGQLNVCPKITSTSATPLIAEIGKTIALTANVRDKDGDALSYSWTVPSGSFAPANALASTYTCAAAGAQTITFSVTDGPQRGCTKTTTVEVSCVAAPTFSSQTPYVVPVAPGVITKAILTVGDEESNALKWRSRR